MRLTHWFALAAFALLVPWFVAGCAELNLYNPLRKSEFAEEKAWGPNMNERVKALRETAKTVRTMSPQQQEQTATQLAQQLPTETNPIMRATIIRTLGPMNSPTAITALQQAITDKDVRVRIAACEAWGNHGGPEATARLGQLLTSEKDLDVRIAAAKALGEFKDPGITQALAVALDDPNPALQHRAIQSLKAATGKDYGGDLVAWRQYVRGQTPADPKPASLADRMRHLF